MLKTSPMLSPSTGASSPAFRHAPSRSSQDSSSSRPQQNLVSSPKPPLASFHRTSSRSLLTAASTSSSDVSMASAPSPAQIRRAAVAVDSLSSQSAGASAEGSKESPHGPRPTSVASRPPILTQNTSPPRSSAARSSVTVATTASTSAQASSSKPNVEDALSPNKRRISPSAIQGALPLGNSPGEASTAPRPASATGSTAGRSSSPKTSKRAKPDERPPKILPQRYEFCPVEDMVELIAHMLGELIATNDAIRISSGGLTRFHSRTPPGISVRDYLHRLARHATLTPPLLLAMVYYIDRLCALYQEFTINTLTVHRFLITAATVAAKGLSDSFWNNTTYARVGGVRVAELKLLELEFLYRVDWKIVPNPEVLVAYYQGLVQRAPNYTLESEGSTDDDELDDDDVDEDEEDDAQQHEAGTSVASA